MRDDVRALLVCPGCRGPLAWTPVASSCDPCRLAFPIVDGIPMLLLRNGPAHDDLHHPEPGKARQTTYYDHQAAAEFEIERPRNSPRLYAWLMREKFRRSLAGIEDEVKGRTALTVCGGSGMEAEFLAEAGFQVISSDLSLGAARRCQERARRFGLPIVSIVADVEHLPFRDRSVALAYVHDGLHHLERPMSGLTEMARVAESAVSLTEPADAAVTALAVRLGLALAYEEAGNRVARLDLRQVRAQLGHLGFDRVQAQRYAMYYRHQPGRMLRLLSHPQLTPIARAATVAMNVVAGRWGNKLAVSAIRPSTGPHRVAN